MATSDWWYVRGKGFTCAVVTDSSGIIIEAAPILTTFIGQSINNLARWSKVTSIKPIERKEAHGTD